MVSRHRGLRAGAPDQTRPAHFRGAAGALSPIQPTDLIPRFLDRWNAWVQVCGLGPMKRLAKTIMAKAEGILRSIATGLSNAVLEAINGNVQAAKRKAKGYRTKQNLKAIVYLIAGDVLANSPT
jgi:hypothetical protein